MLCHVTVRRINLTSTLSHWFPDLIVLYYCLFAQMSCCHSCSSSCPAHLQPVTSPALLLSPHQQLLGGPAAARSASWCMHLFLLDAWQLSINMLLYFFPAFVPSWGALCKDMCVVLLWILAGRARCSKHGLQACMRSQGAGARHG